MQVSGCKFQVNRRNPIKVLAFALFLYCGSAAMSQEIFIDLEDSVYSKKWINVRIDSGYAYSGRHYSIADSLHPFGLGLESRFPEEISGTNCLMHLGGWVKSKKAFDQAVFVITLQKNEEVLYWKDIKLKPKLSQADTWVYFSDSLLIPAGISKTGKIKAYLWNNDHQDTIAIDDLKFQFRPVSNSSFIPDVGSFVIHEANTSGEMLMANDYYTIYYDDDTKSLSIYSTAGQQLIKNIWYHDQRRSDDSNLTGNAPLTLKKVKKRKENTSLVFAVKRANLNLSLEMICSMESPEIRIRVQEKYRPVQRVTRESLVIQSGQRVEEVFRASRKSDVRDFQREYWLGKQGVHFGKKEDSWLIYNQAEISSLQLDTENNQLWVNLDYEKDHPFLHFPLNNDSSDHKEDWSESVYNKSKRRTYGFSIHAGMNIAHLPRIMKNPQGYLSTYIWTEHADFTDISTNRAVYYGSEKITHPDSATGGFVKFNIPVTKSVFYANPDKITNEEISGGRFVTHESTIKGDTSFSEFLNQLHESGHEICLHTPEQFTSSRERMKEALRYMENQFGSPTWIDHGYNNLEKNNREDLVCDGVIKKSANYSMDRWQKYGIRYLWNPYYEDFLTYDNWQFGQLTTKPYRGFGDHFPDPDYWQHPTITLDLYHWPTKSVIYPNDDDKWEYLFNSSILGDLTEGWSVEMNHCYPAWTDPKKGFWYEDDNGEITARDGFNKTLERMASLRDEGLLNITTIKNFLDYQLMMEQIDYEFLPDGRIRVTNSGDKEIGAISFATKGRQVLVNDKQPEQKRIAEDIIFWFDLDTKESKLIRIID